MRQHVNPLSKFFQLPLVLPNPSEIFKNHSLPIHLDIGSARGQFLIQIAKNNPGWNHLGVEIRNTLVISSERDRMNQRIENLKFSFCNANVSLNDWLLNLKYDQLQRVTIQFPDPWFKRRHLKRRVLQPELLLSFSRALSVGRELFIQSDIREIMDSMILTIEESHYFVRKTVNKSIWLKENPYLASTEREIYALDQGIPIYRALYVRNMKKVI